MEKILKRILIPFLFVILTIKSASAEERYIYSNGWSAWTNNVEYTLTTPSSTDKLNNYNLLNNNYYFGILSSETYLSIFQNKNNNLYYILSYDNSSLNINDISNMTGYVYILGYEEDNLQYIVDNFSFISNRTKKYTCSACLDYKYVYASRVISSPASTYLYNNFEDYNLIYTNINIYKDNVKIEVLDPEPEEPEEPETPILNANLNKFDVPNYEKGQCVEVLDKDTIRVFNDNTTSFYTDYFINSNYISRTGQVDVDYEKNCSTLEFTADYKYRNDLSKICFISLCIIGFTILPCYVLWKVFYKRG